MKKTKPVEKYPEVAVTVEKDGVTSGFVDVEVSVKIWGESKSCGVKAGLRYPCSKVGIDKAFRVGWKKVERELAKKIKEVESVFAE